MSLEIHVPCGAGEETFAVAFHPSGFNIVVAYADKVVLMNLLSNSIKEFATYPLKNCKEIRFSNGGHLFACNVNLAHVHVYNFYTGENLQCKGHGKIRSIEWFEDDSGFA